MKTLFLIIMAFIAISTEDSIVPFIYGGTKAREDQFPHQAKIVDPHGKHHCCGVIIAARWILTAHHCFFDIEDPSLYSIIVGTIDVSTKDSGDFYAIKKYLGHENPADDHDIGMIKVDESIRFNNNVKAIPIGEKFIVGGVQVYVSGWGATPYGLPDTLMYMTVNTISNEKCKKMLSSKASHLLPLTELELCTFVPGRIGTCYGDSGSGLVKDGKLFGIVTRGEPCAVGAPDIYIRVLSFKQWINDIMDTH